MSGAARAVPAVQRPLQGTVCVPGSKSLTNRALVLSALARGSSTLRGALDSEDTRSLAAALRTMGCHVDSLDGSAPRVLGCAGALRGGVTVQCGDGGTPARFLMAAAMLADGPVAIDGSARLRERPMADGVELLRSLGVECKHLAAPGCLPVQVHARRLPAGGAVTVGRTASSQFVSGLLLIAPWLANGLRLTFAEPPTSASYIHLTLDALREWGAGVTIRRDAAGNLLEVEVAAGPCAARTVAIQSDASSAIYWAVAAAILPGSSLVLQGVPLDSAQPDAAAIRALGAWGARVEPAPGGTRVSCAVGASPSGRALAGGRAPLAGGTLDAESFPDGSLALMATAAVAAGPSRIGGLGTLRVKESDRIAAMAQNLQALGASCEIGTEWIQIHPVGTPRAAVLSAFNDHRIAMSCAVLGLRLGGVSIADPECVAKSYPGFWAQLEALAGDERPRP